MKHLATFHEKDIYPNKNVPEDVQYTDRPTVKAIIVDQQNKVALVGNNRNNFLLLPGGGVDEGEDIEVAITRECREEIGCDVVIVQELGCIDDYRSESKKHTITFCYIVKIIGQKMAPNHTEQELSVGMYTRWISFTDAILLFKQQKLLLDSGRVDFYNTGFNIARDLLFLEEAEKMNCFTGQDLQKAPQMSGGKTGWNKGWNKDGH